MADSTFDYEIRHASQKLSEYVYDTMVIFAEALHKNEVKLQNRGQLILEHIENSHSFSLELWTASTDASEAYDKWFNNRTDANWKIALE